MDAFRDAARLPGVRGHALGGLVAVCGCGAQFDAPDGIPNLRLPGDARTEAVRRFYEHAPFPGYPPRDSLQALRARAERSAFARLLDRAIPATRGSSRSAAAPARCACIWRARIASSSAPT